MTKNEGFAGKPIEQHPSSVSSVGNQDVLKYSLVHQHGELTRENEKLRARIAALEAALRPFAEKAEDVLKNLHGGHVNYIPELISVTLGDLRAALAAYRGEKG